MVKIEKGKTLVGWIGTGVMGQSMCRHIMDLGHRMVVFNRTRGKALPLLDRGAAWADSPAALARQCGVIFTMVGFPNDVETTYLGSDGLLESAAAGTILVDMTTSRPRLADRIHREGLAKKIFTLDAPVSGGDVGARNATLSIMVGGEKPIFEAMAPMFAALGEKITFQGPAGSGQHTKMCNQIVIAGTMIGVCESLIYAQAAGLDMETMLSSISGGAAACWSLDQLAPRILARNMEPGFFVEHFVKDMGIALEEARRMNLSLPGLALVQQLYLAVMAGGGGKNGTQALILALEQMNGRRVGS